MPHIVDFDTLDGVKEVLVKPKGWISPLYVEYGVGLQYNTTPCYFWRVKGTSHTFVIPVVRFHYLSSNEYEQHFCEALEGFREDYMGWQEQGFEQADWQQEYRDQFSRFIVA